MKFDKLLKKINKDLLMGIVIGIMLVILACFLGFCYSPKRTMLEGMEDKSDSDSQNIKNLQHHNYVATTTSMNSACSLQNNQNKCNNQSYKNNGNNYPCSWDTTNSKCHLDGEKASFTNWISKNNSTHTPAKTSTSSTKSSSSKSM